MVAPEDESVLAEEQKHFWGGKHLKSENIFEGGKHGKTEENTCRGADHLPPALFTPTYPFVWGIYMRWKSWRIDIGK